jgi:hypothetical protein
VDDLSPRSSDFIRGSSTLRALAKAGAVDESEGGTGAQSGGDAVA